jgi:hypothetical protein
MVQKEDDWKDPRRHKRDGHMYIVREYKNEMRGKKIPDDMVVRTNNERWFTHDKVENFVMKSTPCCPMYGVCDNCFGSGLVHRLCQKCRTKGQRYIIVKRNDKILGAEWVLRFFGMSHLDVRADGAQNWITQRVWTMSGIQIQIYIQCRWPARKLLEKENPKFWCEYMELFDDGATVNGAGLWDALETQSRFKDGMTPTCIVRKMKNEQQFNNRRVLDGQVSDGQKGDVRVGMSRQQKMSNEKICGGSF